MQSLVYFIRFPARSFSTLAKVDRAKDCYFQMRKKILPLAMANVFQLYSPFVKVNDKNFPIAYAKKYLAIGNIFFFFTYQFLPE